MVVWIWNRMQEQVVLSLLSFNTIIAVPCNNNILPGILGVLVLVVVVDPENITKLSFSLANLTITVWYLSFKPDQPRIFYQGS